MSAWVLLLVLLLKEWLVSFFLLLLLSLGHGHLYRIYDQFYPSDDCVNRFNFPPHIKYWINPIAYTDFIHIQKQGTVLVPFLIFRLYKAISGLLYRIQYQWKQQ